jgi:RimJ/RimL family protein N-acetyltransferase
MMMASVVAGSGLRSVVLDIEAGNVASERLAERLGAQRRAPTRVEVDGTGTPRTLVVYVLPVAPD